MKLQPIDHSKTYQDGKLRNYFHRARVRNILTNISNIKREYSVENYCDVGCSNGYLTNLVREELGLSIATGYDYTLNLDIGRKQQSSIDFRLLDLNKSQPCERKFDLVTCFETLEHVGDLQAAIENVVQITAPDGVLFISVPIEVGAIGLMKFLAKTLIFKYSLNELDVSKKNYFLSLLKRERISMYRSEKTAFGTHFGFDYRDLDDYLVGRFREARSWKSGTTKFFILRGPGN